MIISMTFCLVMSIQALNLSANPHSLEFLRSRPLEGPPPSMWQEAMLRVGGYYSKDSKLMRAANGLYSCVTETATNAELFSGMSVCLPVCCCRF